MCGFECYAERAVWRRERSVSGMDNKLMVDGVRAVVKLRGLDITTAALDMGMSRSGYQRIMRGSRRIWPLAFRQFCEKNNVPIRDALAMGAERG